MRIHVHEQHTGLLLLLLLAYVYVITVHYGLLYICMRALCGYIYIYIYMCVCVCVCVCVNGQYERLICSADNINSLYSFIHF